MTEPTPPLEVVLAHHKMALQDRESHHAHRRDVMKLWTKRLPWLSVVFGVIGGVGLGFGAIYANHHKGLCARCLDNAHSNWGCAPDEYIADCVESRRHELDQCLTLCSVGEL